MQVGVKILQLYHLLFPDVPDSNDAAIAIAERVRSRRVPSAPLTILALGPPTNIAKAIQYYENTIDDASLSSFNNNNSNGNIAHIYLMGGELTNQQLDLNFRSDRASARTVIQANIPKTIIPIQTCGQVSVTDSWLRSLDCTSSRSDDGDNDGRNSSMLAVCAYLPKMKQQVRWMPRFVNGAVKERMMTQTTKSKNHQGNNNDDCEWKASPNLLYGFIPWDIVALLTISHPGEFVDWRYHRVSIPHCDESLGEPCDGTMEVAEELGDEFNDDGRNINWSGVVRIPHRVRNETHLLEIMLDLIKDVEVSTSSSFPQEPPRMMWGFAPEFAGFGIATIIFLHCCCKMMFLWRGTMK